MFIFIYDCKIIFECAFKKLIRNLSVTEKHVKYNG